MDESVERQLRDLTVDSSLPYNIRQAARIVYSNLQTARGSMFAPASAIPDNARHNTRLREQSVFETHEQSYSELVEAYDVALELERSEKPVAGPSAFVSPDAIATESGDAPAAKRRRARETVATATTLSALPSDVLRLILDAAAQQIQGSDPNISLINKRFREVVNSRLVKMSKPPNSHAAQLAAGPVNAALVAWLQLVLREATNPWGLSFDWNRATKPVSGKSSDPAIGDWQVDLQTEYSGNRRYISLGMGFVSGTQQKVTNTTPLGLYRLQWRPLFTARYIGPRDGGGIQYHPRPVTDPSWLDSPSWTEYHWAPFFAQPHPDMVDHHTTKELLSLSAPSKLPSTNLHYITTGFSRTVYGRIAKSFAESGHWRSVVEYQIRAEKDTGRAVAPDQPYEVRFELPSVIVQNGPRLEEPDNTNRWRNRATILALARCADETSAVDVLTAARSVAHSTRHTAMNLRTNVAQYTYSAQQLTEMIYTAANGFETKEPLPTISRLSKKFSGNGSREPDPYYLSLSAVIPVKFADLGPYQPQHGAQMAFARQLRKLLYLLLLPLKQKDQDLAYDVASCCVIIVNQRTAPWEPNLHEVAVVCSQDMYKAVKDVAPETGWIVDDDGDIHIHAVLINNAGRDPQKAAALFARCARDRLLYYRVEINRTKLRLLLNRHELGSVTAAFTAFWHLLEQQIVSEWKPQAAELDRAEEDFLKRQ